MIDPGSQRRPADAAAERLDGRVLMTQPRPAAEASRPSERARDPAQQRHVTKHEIFNRHPLSSNMNFL